MGKWIRRHLYIFFAIPTVLFFLSSVLISTYLPVYIENQVAQRLVLVNGSWFFDAWQTQRADVFSSYYIFEVLNPEEIIQGVTPIRVREVGPFVFQKFTKTEILGIHESDQSEMTFQRIDEYVLRRDMSNMPALHRPITMVNLPVVAAVSAGRKNGFAWKYGLRTWINWFGESLFMNRTPHDFLLTPYRLPFTLFTTSYDVVGHLNGTSIGVWRIHTGARNQDLAANVITFDGKTQFCWNGPPCSDVTGSDGTIFPRPVRRESRLSVFAPELKTSLIAKYRKDVVEDGLLMYQFNIMEENLWSPDRYPPNECYCIKKNISAFPNYCPSDGILDISDCRDGKPDIVLSQPHFLNAHTIFLKKFQGLTPDQEKHESYVLVEPSLGMTVGAEVRFQVNVDVDAMREFEKYEKVASVIFPSWYLSESVHAGPGALDPIRSYYRTLWLADFVPKVLLSLGVITLAITIALYTYASVSARRRKKNRRTTPTTSDSDESKSTDSSQSPPYKKKKKMRAKIIHVSKSDSKSLDTKSNDSFGNRDSESLL